MGSCDRRRQGGSIPRQVGSEEQEAVLVRTLEGEERSRTGESGPGRGTLSGKALKVKNPLLEDLLIPMRSRWLGHGEQVRSGRGEPMIKCTGSCRPVVLKVWPLGG